MNTRISDEAVEAACNAFMQPGLVPMRAALEAALPHMQPSPAGQGDARTALIEEAIGCLNLIAAQPPLVDQARRALVRALAARQPVVSIPEWFELVIRDVCELEPEDPDAADTVCIRPLDLRLIMERHALAAQAVDLWQPISTAPEDVPADGAVLVCITYDEPRFAGQRMVGEAYKVDGVWWWAGTAPSDYHTDPIEDMYGLGCVTHWQPMPAPALISQAVKS